MKILITGDFVVNQPYSASKINNEIKTLFSQSDFNNLNLVVPVTESNSRILKTDPHLKSD